MTPSHPNAATTLSLSKIMLGYNPRRYFDRKKHEDLVASFRLRGMLQPMLLRPAADVDDTYVVVAGGRRYRAALEAFGPEGEVPVVIREMTDQEALEAAIALVILVFVVWWTMFSGRRQDELSAESPPADAERGGNRKLKG